MSLEANSLSNTEGEQSKVLQDQKNPEEVSAEAVAEQAIVNWIKSRYQRAKQHRLAHERRWQTAWRNFRGIYGPDTMFTETEKSRVFVKITKTKTMAGYGQILDLLFAGNKFPLSIEPSEKPEGAADSVVISMKDGSVSDEEQREDDDLSDIISPYGFPGDGQEVSAGRTVNDILGPTLAKRMEKLKNKIDVKEDGVVTDPQKQVTMYPAAEAAANMERTIFDQLEASNASVHLRRAVLEICALGTGGIRGPLTINKTYHRWVKGEDGQRVYKPLVKKIPSYKSRSIWHLFPDPDATCTDDMSYIVDRHGPNRFQLRELADRPGFRPNVIEHILMHQSPDYTYEWYERDMKDDKMAEATDKYEVLEYWGMLDKYTAEQFGLDLPADTFKEVKQIAVNAFICANRVIRLILNPLTPARIPYALIPYEMNPYQIWGVGIPENMEDSQLIMNGHARMAIDNLALAGNLIFEIDEAALAPGEDLRIYPGRVFKRRGGAPGQSIFGTKFPSTANENMQMFDKFRQLADDQTGIPSVTHGQAGVSGTGRTSSGLSMMMSAAGIGTKTVIKNIDDYLIKYIGETAFAWNMQFNDDDSIVGDLEIKARGTSSLMLKEVRSQRLMMFMQVAANPMFAPLVKWDTVLTDIAKSLEIDPKKLINNPEEAKLQAMLLREFVAAQNPPNPDAGGQPTDGLAGAGGQGGLPGSPAGASASDPSGVGGGTIGTGTSPGAGETSFTGNI